MNGLELFVEHEFLRRALYAALLVAILAAVLGVYIVLRGLSLIGDGLAHISLAGVAIGLAAGVWPVGAGLVAAVLGALLIHLFQSRGIVRGDTAIGILFTAGLAVGILVLSAGPGLGVNAHDYLFGNLLAVTPTDLALIVGVGSGLLLLVTLLHKELFAITFNREAARIAGLPVEALDVAFTIITAGAIVVAVRVVGVLLVSALLVVPAAAALQWSRSFRGALTLAVVFGVTSATAGLWVAASFGTATGPAIAVVATGLFAASAAAARATAGRLRTTSA